MHEADRSRPRPSASDRSPTMSWEEMLSALLTMVGRSIQVYIGSSALGGDAMAAFAGWLPPAGHMGELGGEDETFCFIFDDGDETSFAVPRAHFKGAEGNLDDLSIHIADLVIHVVPFGLRT